MAQEEKVTIVNRAHAGSKMILPEIGEVQLSADGEVEVPNDLASQMIQVGSGWTVKGDSANTSEEIKAALSKMSLEEMLDLAKKAGLDPEKYKKSQGNETLMRNFLKKNLDPGVITF